MSDLTIISSGAFAGLAQVITGYPFDTVKVRYINNNHTSIIKCIKTIKNESYRNFYRGVWSPMVGSIFINVQTFYTYSLFNTYFNTFMSGAMTGVLLASIETPIDLIKSRIQINPTSTYVNVIKSVGVKNSFKGLKITIWRNFISVGLFFWGYETTKNLFDNQYIGSFVGGAVAGFMSWGPNYPLDNIKTRIQTDINSNYKGIVDCIKKTYKTTGFRSFWGGFTPCIIRSMVVNPFIFLAYEIGMNNFK